MFSLCKLATMALAFLALVPGGWADHHKALVCIDATIPYPNNPYLLHKTRNSPATVQACSDYSKQSCDDCYIPKIGKKYCISPGNKLDGDTFNRFCLANKADGSQQPAGN